MAVWKALGVNIHNYFMDFQYCNKSKNVQYYCKNVAADYCTDVWLIFVLVDVRTALAVYPFAELQTVNVPGAVSSHVHAH